MTESVDSIGRGVEEKEAVYFPVSPAKFIFMSVATFGLYELYWFYRNWRYVKARDESNIWAFGRAFFSNFTCYWLITDIEKTSDARECGLVISGGVIAVVYFLVIPTWRLPDPWWLISSFSFVPLLPILSAINSINGKNGAYQKNSRIHVYQYAFLLAFLPLAGITMASALRLVPPTLVIAGESVPTWHEEWMREQGLLNEGEQILYFYGSGMISYRVDGNLLTDQAVISYWQQGEEFYVANAYYNEIDTISVVPGSFIDLTQIRVNKHDGDWFTLLASTELRGDEELIASLRSRIPP